MCLAQGHSTVTLLRREPAAPRSQVKHSTTEPLCSLSLKAVAKSAPPYHTRYTTVLPAKGDSDVMFCLLSDQGLMIDRSLVN